MRELVSILQRCRSRMGIVPIPVLGTKGFGVGNAHPTDDVSLLLHHQDLPPVRSN